MRRKCWYLMFSIVILVYIAIHLRYSKYNKYDLERFMFEESDYENGIVHQSIKTTTTTIPKIKLFYWEPPGRVYENFGDRLSFELVRRIVGDDDLKVVRTSYAEFTRIKKLLAIGSIIGYANQNDIIWGSGYLNSNQIIPKHITSLDVRALRGPMSRSKLMMLDIKAPEVYGDPALLVPYFFPEYKRSKNPRYDYIVIPHKSQQNDSLFDRQNRTVVWPTQHFKYILSRIVDSKFVISVSLHGIVVAESFGIPARLLNHNGFFDDKDSNTIFKYKDYYYGTQRFNFTYANSIEEALKMGGEPPIQCDLDALYAAFPKEYFGNKLVYDRLPTLQTN